MYRGFPTSMIRLLRCFHDNAQIDFDEWSAGESEFVRDGVLRCRKCRRVYIIEQGIVRMLEPDSLSGESGNERARRDEIAGQADNTWERSDWSMMEVEPTIEASQPLDHTLVLELGCGTGRCTIEMAAQGASVLATDFSMVSLQALAARAESEWMIGLLHADCTQLAVQPRAFHLVASTLMSNLPTPAQRASVMRIAAYACGPSGKFVFGTHHYSMRSIIRREVRSGYYREVPIYRYLFRSGEITSETRKYFGHVECHPMVIAIPLLSKLGAPVVKISRISEHIPLLNKLGQLLLVVAREPLLANEHVGDSGNVFHVFHEK
jgi:2-polyprenyl-3-methyl-5-hydroxy-6-metoxy-1,4-benzoquinol methylase